MPEDVTAKLATFTPTGLDRDAALFTTGFAAGKAAGRRTVWKWLACALLSTNAVTLAALVWPKPTTPVVVEPAPPPSPDSAAPYPAPAPSSYLALMNGIDAGPSAAPAGNPVSSPPLTPRSLADPRFH